MATWSEIQAYMRASYKLQADEPSMIQMTWSYDTGRKQRIVLRKFRCDDIEMLEFKSPFTRIGYVDATELLRENARLPLGFVALSGEVCLLLHNARIDELNLTTFDNLLRRLAGAADQLEHKYGSGDCF